MGSKMSRLRERFFPKDEREIRVGMLGLDNAGKTTALYQLTVKRNVQPIPTIGFNVENIRCGNLLLNVWDVSGSEPRSRVLWHHYNHTTGAIIFVIDCADMERLQIAVEELHWLCARRELSQSPFLIFANKQDMPGALGAEQLVPMLRLQRITQQWSVQECCAIHGIGLWDGLLQLTEMIEEAHRNRNSCSIHCVNK